MKYVDVLNILHVPLPVCKRPQIVISPIFIARVVLAREDVETDVSRPCETSSIGPHGRDTSVSTSSRAPTKFVSQGVIELHLYE